jgi:hypothetical protein
VFYREMQRLACLGVLTLGLSACDQTPTDLLREFPPPRLASETEDEQTRTRCDLSPASEVRLTLRTSGAWRAELRGGASGWVELASFHATPSSGRVVLDLASLREEPGNAKDTGGVSIGPGERSLQLDWSVSTSGQRDGTPATLQLNSHRSEVLLATTRRRGSRDEAPVIDVRTPSGTRLPLADHGLAISAPNKAGTHRTSVDAADLHLRLVLDCKRANSE